MDSQAFHLIVSVLCVYLSCHYCNSLVCPVSVGNGVVYEEQCYQFNNINATWQSARSTCKGYNGTLATIPNEGIQEFITRTVMQLAGPNSLFWIGGYVNNTLEGATAFTWITVQENSFTNWEENYPSEESLEASQCMAVSTVNGMWLTAPCDNMEHTYSYICQYEAVEIDVIETTSSKPSTGGMTVSSSDSTSTSSTTYRGSTESSSGTTDMVSLHFGCVLIIAMAKFL